MPNVFMHNFSKFIVIDGNTGEPGSQPVNPAKVICTEQISRGCHTCLGVKESTPRGNKLDADSLQTAKVKSFAEDKCEQSGLKDVDLFFLDGTVFSTLVCYCSSERETQDMLRKLFDSIIDNPGSFEFYCPTEDTMKCTIVSMEGQLVTFARAGDKWLVYENNEGLQDFSSRTDLQNSSCLDVHPGVLFLKVVK